MIVALQEELRSASKVGEVDEYIVGDQRVQSLTRPLGGTHTSERLEARRLSARVFVDRELGRGHSEFSVLPGASLRSQISQSAARALGAIGPSWRLRPPSAPARLRLFDPSWAKSLSDSADLLWEQFQAHQPSTLQLLQGSLTLQLADTRTVVSNGFDNGYRSTKLQIVATMQAKNGAPIHLRLGARNQDGLRWQAIFEDAERRSLLAHAASANEGGACDLLLLSSAYQPQGDSDYGLWSALVHQCQAGLAASGLARYQVGQEILKQPARGDTLSLRSDGTRDFGWRSAPFDTEGQAVRRFSIVENGKAAGQSVGYIEAARQGMDSNGGVRDLVIDSGKRSLEELATPGERPLLVVHELSDLHAEVRGGLCLRIAGSEQRVRDAAGAIQTKATQGGVLCGNLYQWLQDARFSSEQDDLLWLKGPRAIRFNQLQLHV